MAPLLLVMAAMQPMGGGSCMHDCGAACRNQELLWMWSLSSWQRGLSGRFLGVLTDLVYTVVLASAHA
jgi:hypothetical protein